MKRISLLCIISTTIWIILMIWELSSIDDSKFEEILIHIKELPYIYYLNYLNVSLLTIIVTYFFVSFYTLINKEHQSLSLFGLLFVNSYCVLNLFVYLSQITIVPMIIKEKNQWLNENTTNQMLYMLIQIWRESIVSYMNFLAYSLLGIPSIIYGGLLYRITDDKNAERGCFLFVLSGLSSIIGFIGKIMDNRIIEFGCMIGGVLFYFSLIFFYVYFKRKEKND